MSPVRTKKVPVTLDDGTLIYVEVETLPGERQDVVGGKPFKFDDVSSALESIVKAVTKPIYAAMPTKASVKFGLEVEVKEGHLIAALVRSTGTANLEITLEWEQPKPEKS
ncbi:MAG: CU044_2847 family protein [Cyanobacteria bacterium J06635_1]